MRPISLLSMLGLWLALGACSHGPTEPDFTPDPPQTIESKSGAHSYVCRKQPRELSPATGHIPVYKCR